MPLNEARYISRSGDDKAFDAMNSLMEEEDIFYEDPSSTSVSIDEEGFAQQQYAGKLMGLSYENVKGTDMENDWFDVQGVIHGTISKDKRNALQRAADEFYESGPIGATAAAVADLLPGIPYVDIIDPPEQLADPSMQSTRNILGAGGMILEGLGVPKAVGRVATNLRMPFDYGGTSKKVKEGLGMIPGGKQAFFKALHERDPDLGIPEEFMYTGIKALPRKAKDAYRAIKKGVRSILKDEPLYGSLDPRTTEYAGMGLTGYKKERAINLAKQEASYTGRLAADNAREFLYRRIFGLKPRAGKNIFKENADGTLSFNPRSTEARELIGEIIDPTDPLALLGNPPRHSVMGGYSRKHNEWLDTIKYEDIWDFKLHPSEWKDMFKLDTDFSLGDAANVGMRTVVDAITTSPRIKGTIDVGKFKAREAEIQKSNKLLMKAIFGPSGKPKN